MDAIGAFNLGNALAAWLGGLTISAGFGYTSPNWVGALLALAALVLALVSALLERRTGAPSRTVAGSVRGTPASDEPADPAARAAVRG